MQQPPNYPNHEGWQQQQPQSNMQYPPQWQSMPPQPKEAEWQPTPQYEQRGYRPIPPQPQYYPPPQYYAAPGYPPQQPNPMQPYPQQPPQFYQQPYPPYPMMQAVNVNVNLQQRGPGLMVRTLYFLFIGWWLGFFWLNLGFTLCALIVTLPVGLVMLNRLPQIMTLRQPGTTTKVNVALTSTMMQPGMMPGPMMTMQTVNVNVQVGGTKQINFFVRALYFIFVGFWVGAFWAYLAYGLCLTLVLLPVGVMMFNRLPAVLTLRRN